MPTESGNRKVTDNYRQLIDHVTTDANYNPANPLISKAAPAAHHTAVNAALDAVDNTAAPFRIAVNNRQETFDPVSALVVIRRPLVVGSTAASGCS